MGFIEVVGDDAGRGTRRLARGDQHRRGGRGIERQKLLAPLPDPLLHQPEIEAVLTQRQADEARLRAERVVKQREHGVLDSFAALRRPFSPRRRESRGSAPNYRSTRSRQPAFDIFHVAAGRRIGAKATPFYIPSSCTLPPCWSLT